jgi:peroxiredoxin
VSVVAVLGQKQSQVRRYVEDKGLPFFILVDETREVMKRYGVWHRIGLDAWNIARPALFVIESEGTIRAVFVGETQAEFPTPDELNEILPELQSSKVPKLQS